MAECKKFKEGVPGRPGLPPPAPGRCRIGSLNVQGIDGKVSKVVDLFRANHLSILGLQEVWMRPDLIEAFRAAVEKAGLILMIDPEDCWADAQDRAGRGVAIITSHPVSMDANPLKEKWPGRALFARAHVKARRPLRLGIPYCNASDERDAGKEAAAMLKHLLELDDPAFALGDWNLVQEQRPFASLLGKMSGGRRTTWPPMKCSTLDRPGLSTLGWVPPTLLLRWPVARWRA